MSNISLISSLEVKALFFVFLILDGKHFSPHLLAVSFPLLLPSWFLRQDLAVALAGWDLAALRCGLPSLPCLSSAGIRAMHHHTQHCLSASASRQRLTK